MGIFKSIGGVLGSATAISTIAAGFTVPLASVAGGTAGFAQACIWTQLAMKAGFGAKAMATVATWVGTHASWLATLGTPIATAAATLGPLAAPALLVGVALLAPAIVRGVGSLIDQGISALRGGAVKAASHMKNGVQNITHGKAKSPELQLQSNIAPTVEHSTSMASSMTDSTPDFSGPGHPGNKFDDSHWRQNQHQQTQVTNNRMVTNTR